MPHDIKERAAGRCPETGDGRTSHARSPILNCAYLNKVRLFYCLRTIVCGDESTKSIVFLSFRTGPKRLPRPASWGSPPPKAFPALGIHPASGITSLLVVKLRPMGHNASSIPDYREIHQVSQPKSFTIRSTPRMQLHVSDLSASPRQGVQRESVRLGPNASLCTHCHDGVVRSDTEHGTKWRERAMNDPEPLILEMAPCILTCDRRDGTCSIRRQASTSLSYGADFSRYAR